MSRMTRRPDASLRRLQVIGALVVVGAIAVATLAVVKPNPLADALTVRAMFDNAGGMGVAGTEVRMAGTPVGKVTDTRRVGDQALVVMSIEPGAGPIGRDATAELRPRTAFEGTTFIDLHPGSSTRGRLGERTIPLSRTHNFVALDEALRFAQPDVRTALQDDVHALGSILEGGGGAGLRGTLRGAPALSRGLALGAHAARGRTQTELRGAVDGFAKTVHAVAQEQAALTPALRGAAATLRAVDANGGAPLDRALRVLPRAVRDLDGGGRELARIVDRVDVVGGELRPGLRALAPTLDRVAPLVRAARPVLTQAPPLLRDLRRAVGGAADGSAPAAGLLRDLDPTLKLLDSSLLPALNKKSGLELPAYLQFIALFQGGAGAFRPFLPKGSGLPLFDAGPGHFVRFNARFLTGIGAPLAPCSGIGRISPQAAALFSQTGMCTP